MSSESIDRAREEIDAAWLRSDADGITRHLADDAVLMPPNDTKKVGRQLINGWLRGFFEHYTMTDLAMPERELTVAGDWAIERSLYEWTLRPKDGSVPLRDQANWIGIWRREQDGQWSEACGMWNSALPAGGSEPAQPSEQGASADPMQRA